MNVFFYDSFLSNNKYNRLIAKIETRLTDLNLNGKIIRLGVIKSINNILYDELRRGAKTIIGVGTDALFYDLINSLSSIQNNKSVLGFIPIGSKNNTISQKLNIPKELDACNVLSARIIKNFNLISANNDFFLLSAKILAENISIQIDSDYFIEIPNKSEVLIKNTQKKEKPLLLQIKSDHSLLGSKYKNSSSIPFKKLLIKNKKPLTVDNIKELKCPSTIQPSNKTISLITGKMIK